MCELLRSNLGCRNGYCLDALRRLELASQRVIDDDPALLNLNRKTLCG